MESGAMTTMPANSAQPTQPTVPVPADPDATPRWLRAGGWSVAGVLAAALAWLLLSPAPAAVTVKLEAPTPATVVVIIRMGEASTMRVERSVPADGTLTFELPRSVVTFVGLELGHGETLRVSAAAVTDASGRVIGAAPQPYFTHRNDMTYVTQGETVTVSYQGDAVAPAELRLSYPLFCASEARQAFEVALAALLAALGLLAVLGRLPRANAVLASPWLLRGVLLVAALAVLAGAFDIGWTTRLGAHPDEHGHMVAAQFYTKHWVPRPVGDPELESTMMRPWGRSYLFYLDVVYMVAGKVGAVLGAPLFFGLRTFHLILLVGLFALALWKGPRHPALALALAATPQVWYAFTYFNGDAFPLAVALAAAVAVAAMLASTDAALFDGRWAERIGFLLGLLLVSKANYYVLALFLLFLLAVPALEMAAADRRRRLWRVGHAALIALVVLSVRLGYEESINDFRWGRQIDAYVESHAQAPFRYTERHQPDSYPGLYLREKGVAFRMLFTTYDWHRLTTYSYLGLYGPMSIPSPRVFYALLGALTVLGLGLLMAVTWRGGGPAVRLGVLGFAGLGALLIVQSLWNSWSFDFQPQGRYLFPALPGAVAALATGARRLPSRYLLAGVLVFFAIGLWGFWWVGAGLIAR
jgi:hypothetical protein